MNIRKSKHVIIFKFILGGIVLSFSLYRILNIFNVSPFWVTYPGIAVLVIGVINILKGMFSKNDSKITRAIEIGIGMIAIIVGLFVKVYITDSSSKLTWFILLFLIIQSIGFIATGIAQRVKARVIGISKIIVGIGIDILLTGSFIEFHDLPIKLITILLSVNLFLIGIEIITGSVNHKIVKKP